MEILRSLRKADFDCLVGINLLREGLDLPEVSLVAVLDADKEGFLRSETSLIQTAGRAARHIDGKVILYADHVTDSMQRMIDVTESRRRKQAEYNRANGVTPRQIVKEVPEGLSSTRSDEESDLAALRSDGADFDVQQVLLELEEEMLQAAESLEFERAAVIRDQINEFKRAEGLTAEPGTATRKKGKTRYKRASGNRSVSAG